MSKPVILVTSIMMLGCDPHVIVDFENIAEDFAKNINVYEELRDMSSKDIPPSYCYSISQRVFLGWTYKQKNDKWYKSTSSEQLSFEDMLLEVGVSESRYKRYLELFESTKFRLYSVFRCNSSDDLATETSIAHNRVNSVGIGRLRYSTCTTEIIHRGKSAVPENVVIDRASLKYIPLDENWYIKSYCRR